MTTSWEIHVAPNPGAWCTYGTYSAFDDDGSRIDATGGNSAAYNSLFRTTFGGGSGNYFLLEANRSAASPSSYNGNYVGQDSGVDEITPDHSSSGDTWFLLSPLSTPNPTNQDSANEVPVSQIKYGVPYYLYYYGVRQGTDGNKHWWCVHTQGNGYWTIANQGGCIQVMLFSNSGNI